MTSSRSEVLLHPVRLRVVLAITGEEMTTTQIGERLPDIPPATLYRHVAMLADAGLLEVARERRSRGSLERTYRLSSGASHLGADEVATMTVDEHMAGFRAFIGAGVGDFARYIESDKLDSSVEGLSYRQATLWLSDLEHDKLIEELGGVLEPYLAFESADGRSRSHLTTILIPDPEA